MKYLDYYSSPLGTMLILEEHGYLTRLCLSDREKLPADFPARQKDTVLIRSVRTQLTEYFQGSRKAFDLPLNPCGTLFQQKVWKALCTIPYGETRSYKEIAVQLENPRGCRAVGMANNRNPIMIIIPCHRVIGSDGSLTGYAGGLDIKEWLLEHEHHFLSSEPGD